MDTYYDKCCIYYNSKSLEQTQKENFDKNPLNHIKYYDASRPLHRITIS